MQTIPPLAASNAALIVGIDLAWGERNRDGLCLIQATRAHAEVVALDHTLGDPELFAWLEQHLSEEHPALLLIDAPIVIANQTGSRAVDRLTHRYFHREHAGCYPANLGKCPRPARIGQLLQAAGYSLGWDLTSTHRLAAEVYPHPAMIRLFALDRIVKYKKGAVNQKRLEFARLQRLIRKALVEHFPLLSLNAETKTLLKTAWTKPVEDCTDALFCALIGYHHWLHHGAKSEPIGDLKTGFILLPARMS